MKHIKSLMIIVIFLFRVSHMSAQVDSGHHVYGLVVGVSDYKDNAFKDLKFADDDAQMFADFLKTQLVKPSDTGNIILLTNKRATAIPVWNEIYKIQNKAKAGDTVYLYFSGHGSANTPEDIFIICHDAAKGQLDAGGCVNINSLKNRIKILISKGVKVILITDACRTNEVNDVANNLIFTEALSKNSGEIQFTSCSSNERSLEDRRWGKGHGVFTWYLLNGWMGMADNNNNNRVTLEELHNYVARRVGQDTYDSIQDRSLQTPDYCCSKFNSTLMATVNPEIRRKLQDSEESGETNLYAALIPRYYTRGSEEEELKDSLTIVYYAHLNEMIDKEQFLEPDTACAIYYYEKFAERQKSGTTLEESKLDLIAGMANKAQSYIQDYLQGNDSFERWEFRYASRLMYRALSYMDSSNHMYTSLKARALFLEANSMMRNQDEMLIAFHKLDSSLALEPNKAYVYYNKARIYEKFNVYFREAEKNYLKAIELAPKWAYPLIGLGNMYIDSGWYAQGMTYFNRAIDIQPGPYIQTLLGYTYEHLTGKPEYMDSAILHYNLALESDSSYIDAMLGLASAYGKLENTDKAVEYYLKALETDTTYYFTYIHFGALFYNAKNMEKAEYYYRKSLEYYPNNVQAHLMLGHIYNYYLNEKQKAVEAYYECVKLDYYYTKAYKAIGIICLDRGQYAEALSFLKYPWTYDPNYNPVYIAKAYLDRAKALNTPADNDSAKIWLDTAIHYYPNDYYSHTMMGTYYWRVDSTQKSLQSFRTSMRLDSSYYFNWLMLGYIHYEEANYDSAIWYYNQGIAHSPESEDMYEYLWQLHEFGTKNFRLASEAADMAIRADVNRHYFYFLKTYSAWNEGNFALALESIDSADALYPNYGRYLFARAMVLCSMNRHDESLETLKRSMDNGLYAVRDDFYNGSFRSLEGNKKFEKLVKKYLRKKTT